MNLEKSLKEIGLENNEARIYLESLRMGTSPASILAKKTGIPRTTARFACESLVKKQLMTESNKGNTKIFTAEHPNKIKNLLTVEKNFIEEKQDMLDGIMRDLISMQNPFTKLPKVTYYEGVDGVKKVLWDSLTAKTDLLVYSDLKGYLRHLKDFNVNEYAPKRKELGIKEKAFVPDTDEAKKYLEGYIANELTKVKMIDNNNFPFYSEVNIYDGKVSYVTFSERGHVGVLIENKEIYETQKSVFNLLWEKVD